MNPQNTKILITGANGFIGRSLAGHIVRNYKSWSVYGIDRKTAGKGSFVFDITDKDKLAALIGKIRPHYIFHLAGTTDEGNFKKLLFSNVYTTQILFEAIMSIERYNPRIFVPGSAAEYGKIPPSGMPIKEDHPLCPVSLYGFSKVAQEKLSLFYASKGLDIVIGRIFNIMGKGVPVNLSIGRFAHELALIKKKRKKPLLYTKGLDSKRDFLDIDDVCRYIVHIAKHGRNGDVYNICRGRSYRMRNLLDILTDISGMGKVKIITGRINEDKSDFIGSTKKLGALIKMRPKTVDESLRDAYLYYLNR